MSNQRPPNAFTIGPTKAMFSPQPGLPRWQKPYCSFDLSVSFSAYSAIWS